MGDMPEGGSDSSYPPPSSTQMQQYHPYDHSPEVYRGSPSQQNSTSSAPLLPPIHHFEGQHVQSQQFAAVPMNGAQMQQHPPPYNSNQFHYANGPMQPAPMASNVPPGQNGLMRFPLPPQPPQPGHMSGGRHKKDIKRRTKTGCLTCRKRRIKCDEGHPTCRNCQKSKRECLGYDPIFKQQTGPAPIQPAPPSAGTQSSKSTPASVLPHNPYQSPQSFPGTGGTFVPANNSQQPLDGTFEYGASLDPALASGDQSLTMAANSFSTTLPYARKIKTVTMDQLFAINDVPPRYHEREAPPPNMLANGQHIDDFYRFHFAPGLDRLFETNWYNTRGMTHIRQNPILLDFIMQCEEQFRNPDATPQSLEARLVWQLATMPRDASHSNGANGHMSDHLTLEVLPRIDTLEHLLTGQYLPQNQIPLPPSQQHDHSKYNEQSFWLHLGRFCSIRDESSDPSSLQQINDNLAAMRGILGMMENRDVLYSLAIARYIGGRMSEFHPRQQLPLTNNDPNDDVNKLEVARHFIESQDARGTTQVIQRICGMAMRSWTLQKQ